MKTDNRWIWGGLVLALLLAAAWNLRDLEWSEEEVEVGPTGPARRNPWYGVELLLQGRGVAAQSVEGLTALPPTDHVILWMARQPSDEPLGRLEAWVRSGGHLVAALPSGTQRAAFVSRESQHGVIPERRASLSHGKEQNQPPMGTRPHQ